jgi:membrane protease YdiL (CAAX protease family)
METLAVVAALAGMVAAAIAWRLVARGRDVWRTMPPLFAVLGVLAVWLAPSVDAPAAETTSAIGPAGEVALGLATGGALFLATRVFVAIVGRSPVFARHVAAAYGRAEVVPVATALVLSVFVTAVGEELFWRGLVYRLGAERTSIGIAAIACWLVYVLANLPSRLLPIVAAAIVGGALWAALAWWTGGILAPIASHMLWTGLMLGFPPGPPRAEVT